MGLELTGQKGTGFCRKATKKGGLESVFLCTPCIPCSSDWSKKAAANQMTQMSQVDYRRHHPINASYGLNWPVSSFRIQSFAKVG
jgi:hypothetical protein